MPEQVEPLQVPFRSPEVPPPRKAKASEREEMLKEDRMLQDAVFSAVAKLLLCCDLTPPHPPSLPKSAKEADILEATPRVPSDESGRIEVICSAIEFLATKLQETSATMTSVPKPLKFSRTYLDELESVFELIVARLGEAKRDVARVFADVLSIIALVRSVKPVAPKADKLIIDDKSEPQKPLATEPTSTEYKMRALDYRCRGSKEVGLDSWGAEYLRSLLCEVVEAYAKIQEEEAEEASDMKDETGKSHSLVSGFSDAVTKENVVSIANSAVTFLWARGAHIEAMDVMMETDQLVRIYKMPLDHMGAVRFVQYARSIAELQPQLDKQIRLFQICYDVCVSHGNLVAALIIAMRIEDRDRVMQVFKLASPLLLRVQDVLPASAICNVTPSTEWLDHAHIVVNSEALESAEAKSAEGERRRAIRRQMALLSASHRFDLNAEDLVPVEEDANRETCYGTKTADRAAEVEFLDRILRRAYYPTLYGYLAKELDVVDPKTPDDVFKTELEDPNVKRQLRPGAGMDSARKALAEAYVNGFVNCAFGTDKLMLEDGSSRINKCRGSSVTAATGTIGLLCLWQLEEGLNKIDRYQYSAEPFMKAGALLAFGLNSANVKDPCDPPFALVADALESDKAVERQAAMSALGYAYVGTQREDIAETLVPAVLDCHCVGGIETSAAAAMALGLIFVGSRSDSISEAIVQTMIERSVMPGGLDHVTASGFVIGLGLIYLEAKGQIEGLQEALEAVAHPLRELAHIVLEACAYVGTGDMSAVQGMLQKCIKRSLEHETGDEEIEETASKPTEVLQTDKGGGEFKVTQEPTDGAVEELKAPDISAASEGHTAVVEDSSSSSSSKADAAAASSGETATLPDAAVAPEVANNDQTETLSPAVQLYRDELKDWALMMTVLAIAMISCRGKINSQMTMRMLSNHFIQFDGLPVRRAIPIAVALLHVSNPTPQVIELMSKLCHDQDADVALHAIVALGVIGAGTNSTAIAQLLRQLSNLYAPDSNAMFAIRMSQGLLFLGKGLLTLNPLHDGDLKIINKSEMAGLLAFLISALNSKNTLLTIRQHLDYFHLTPTVRPRWLVTVDEELNPIPVEVRVGQGVDTAGLAGRPLRITGFQTHTTPVLLSADEQAQIASNEYEIMSPIVEDVVIIRKLKPEEIMKAENFQ